MSFHNRRRTRRDRRKDAATRNAKGDATAKAIHASKPRSERPWKAYLAETKKPAGERSAEKMVALRARFTRKPKTRKPRRNDRRGRGRGRGRGPQRRGPPMRARR